MTSHQHQNHQPQHLHQQEDEEWSSISSCSTSSSNRQIFLFPPTTSLSSILDEQFVITHTATTTALGSSRPLPSRGHYRSSSSSLLPERPMRRQNKDRSRLRVVLDQIDGIHSSSIGGSTMHRNIEEEQDAEDVQIRNFITARTYPRGVYIRRRRQVIEQSQQPSSSSFVGSRFELVVAEEAFKYWEGV